MEIRNKMTKIEALARYLNISDIKIDHISDDLFKWRQSYYIVIKETNNINQISAIPEKIDQYCIVGVTLW